MIPATTLSPLGTQYNFTAMTSRQAFDAANQLASTGELSAEAASRLEGAAQGIDYTPTDRSNTSRAHTLADPTVVDWVAYMQQSSNWFHANADSKGVESTDDLLSQLKAYRPVTLDHTLNIISTRA